MDELVQLRHAQLLVLGDRHRDDLLGQHVERVARHDGRLDLPFSHPLDHDGGLEEVGAELGEDPPLRDLAHAVPGAPYALEAAGDGLRRLHLEHQVHRAHVDPELERRCGHQAGQLTGLEQLLDHQALLAGQRAVVGPRDLDGRVVRRTRAVARSAACLGGALSRQLVEAHGQPLGAAAVVHEHDRRAVLLDQVEQLWVDGRPDRPPAGRLARHGDDV